MVAKVKGKRSPGGEGARSPYLMPLVAGGVIVALVVFVALFRPHTGTTLATAAEGLQLPKLGDHWHASLDVYVCGEKQPQFPFFPGSFHSHGDGVIHLHPETQRDEGAQNNLAKYFSGAGAVLTNTSLRMPGGTLLRNGDPCPDGQPGQVRILVNGEPHPLGEAYVPQNGARVRIEFATSTGASTPAPAAAPFPPVAD